MDVELSVVVPAFDEASRIAVTVVKTLDYLNRWHPKSELIVVDDGSKDDTRMVLDALASRDHRLMVIAHPHNRGKGAAVRTGVAASVGAYVLFMDADLATPIEELPKLLAYCENGEDVVIGSRASALDIRKSQPLAREMMGRTFNRIIRSLLDIPWGDTQCGFKLFRGDLARSLFAEARIEGFAFDVEILLAAQARGSRIREVPVVWAHGPNSKVSMMRDSTRMLADVIKLRRRNR
jgi:dolichyl-phosphate beta-glucosyltransferase